MTYRYWVAYRTAAGFMDGAEVTVGHELDNALGRSEAQKVLAARGVPNPTITGWALRSAVDQEKQS